MSGKHVDPDTSLEETTEYVTLVIAEQLFGVPVVSINDVFSPQNLTPVPLASPEIAGVLNLRGRIVTAIDSRVKLGLSPGEDVTQMMAVGVEKNGESFGILVDSVGEVLRLSAEDFEPNPINLDRRWQSVSGGVYRLDGKLLVVLDIDKIIGLFGEVVATGVHLAESA